MSVPYLFVVKAARVRPRRKKNAPVSYFGKRPFETKLWRLEKGMRSSNLSDSPLLAGKFVPGWIRVNPQIVSAPCDMAPIGLKRLPFRIRLSYHFCRMESYNFVP